jgi:hypothetical protein
MQFAYQIMADVILLLHVLFALFVVGGQLLIVLGAYQGWFWIRNWWFRISHLCAIAIVVLQSWVSLICPLTIIEMRLRAQVGQEHYEGTFMQFWLQRFLYYEAPAWIFITVYTLFGVLVVFTLFCFQPKKKPGSIQRGT